MLRDDGDISEPCGCSTVLAGVGEVFQRRERGGGRVARRAARLSPLLSVQGGTVQRCRAGRQGAGHDRQVVAQAGRRGSGLGERRHRLGSARSYEVLQGNRSRKGSGDPADGGAAAASDGRGRRRRRRGALVENRPHGGVPAAAHRQRRFVETWQVMVGSRIHGCSRAVRRRQSGEGFPGHHRHGRRRGTHGVRGRAGRTRRVRFHDGRALGGA